jgi:glycyl-tRNA synthetase beta chain
MDIGLRVAAVHAFRGLPAAESLAAANKRIRNILKQADAATNGAFDPALSAQDEERALGERISAIKGEVEGSFANADYEGGLKKLAGLRPAVDAFFDKVLVMHEDEAIRKNRLALLAGLSNLFLGVADISRLQS